MLEDRADISTDDATDSAHSWTRRRVLVSPRRASRGRRRNRANGAALVSAQTRTMPVVAQRRAKAANV
eukprot:CAMPEP_0119273844 /NCGR_PEP_ID=MMETSP1329-20130426/10990_1 /TAXON_ID=114041 /ORGANISM="Genus nov. species nov., Strain RCC1024" /LENGTH=67 /DNA_ID=CAMNT_0007274095 /DNA_START=56 /DNA_END=255 /DNA_ORIENTATION=+